MPGFGLISRKDLIRYLKRFGFQGPYSGGKHQFIIREYITIWVPNPHQADIGRGFLARVLRQAGIDKEQWENL